MKNYVRVIWARPAVVKDLVDVWGSEFSVKRGKLRYDGIKRGINPDSYACMCPVPGCKKLPLPGDMIRLKKIVADGVCHKIQIVRSKSL
jgi:hypothetical protein